MLTCVCVRYALAQNWTCFGCAFVYDHFKLSQILTQMCGNQIHYSLDVCLPFHSQKLKDRVWIMFTMYCCSLPLSLSLQSSNRRTISHANTKTHFTYSNSRALELATHSHTHWCHFSVALTKATNLLRTKFSFLANMKFVPNLCMSERVSLWHSKCNDVCYVCVYADAHIKCA